VHDFPVLRAGARPLSKAGSAGAHVLRHVRVHRMGAVTADKPPILISDHRSELYAHQAMGAANDQDGVGRQCSLLLQYECKRTQGTNRPAVYYLRRTLRISETCTEFERSPVTVFRQVCRGAGRSDQLEMHLTGLFGVLGVVIVGSSTTVLADRWSPSR
jgi:hypothetical protein